MKRVRYFGNSNIWELSSRIQVRFDRPGSDSGSLEMAFALLNTESADGYSI